MSIKDTQWLINKRILNKKNIFLFSIMIIILIILFICINMICFIFDFKKSAINNNKLYRTLIINGNDQIQEIKQLPHVQLVESTKFYNGALIMAKEFDNELNGQFVIKTTFKEDNFDIIYGRNIENSHEMICPNNFYPHDSYLVEQKINKIYPTLYLKGQDIIGKTISIKSSNEDFLDKEYNFTIVGTYDATKTQDMADTCYVSKEDTELIKSKYKGLIEITKTDETIEKHYEEYNDYMVRIDDSKYLSDIEEKIKNLGFNVQRAIINDDETIKLFLSIPIVLSAILIIIIINIIYNFINKKLKYQLNNYILLRNCGFNYKQIKKIENLENLEILITTFIISFVLYLGSYAILTNTILLTIKYYNIKISIPYIWFIITILLVIVLTIFINNKILKRKISNVFEVN